MKIAVEYIKWLQSEIDRINEVDLKDITFFEGGVVLDIPKETIEDFRFCGLSNMFFITCEAHKGK